MKQVVGWDRKLNLKPFEIYAKNEMFQLITPRWSQGQEQKRFGRGDLDLDSNKDNSSKIFIKENMQSVSLIEI
jgi:hypothetical protein